MVVFVLKAPYGVQHRGGVMPLQDLGRHLPPLEWRILVITVCLFIML